MLRYLITSEFISALEKYTGHGLISIGVTLNNTDVSNLVLNRPVFQTDAENMKAQTLQLRFSNVTSVFNSQVQSPSYLQSCDVYIHISSTNNYRMTHKIFSGKTSERKISSKLEYSLMVTNKLQELETKITSSFPGGNGVFQKASEVYWKILTDGAGYSNIASESNPDIDINGGLNFQWTVDSWIMLTISYNKPISCMELLKTTLYMYNCWFGFLPDGRITPYHVLSPILLVNTTTIVKYGIVSGGQVNTPWNWFPHSQDMVFDETNMWDVNWYYDNKKIINHMYLRISDGSIYERIDVLSANSYGLYPAVTVDHDWCRFTSTSYAHLFADTIFTIFAEPLAKITFHTGLNAFGLFPRALIRVTYPPLGLNSKDFRIQKINFDWQRAECYIEAIRRASR